jgi:predicted RNA-binding protein with TRAM domain
MKKIFTLMLGIIMTIAINANNYFVDPNISASGLGNSWGTAFKTLGEAETAASGNPGVDNIYIKGGSTISVGTTTAAWSSKAENYYGGFDPNSSNTDPALRPRSDVDGNGIPEPWEFTYPTILSNTNVPANTTTGAFILVASTTLDGFTISNGTISKPAGSTSITFTNPIGSLVQNCIFSGSNITYPGLTGNTLQACLIKNLGDFRDCLFEKNTVSLTIGTATADMKFSPIFEFSFGSTPCYPTLTRSVFRNNKISISNGDVSGGKFTGAYLRGLIINVAPTSTVQTATISDCLVYNNEVIYTVTGTSTIASLSKASILGAVTYTNNLTVDKWINNTVANNKMTNCISAMYVPSTPTQNHIIYNNVFWNNQNNGSPVSMYSGASSTGQGIGTVISNNIMDVATTGPTNWTWTGSGSSTFSNNLIDLSSTNTTASKGPQFKAPNSIIGASASFSSGTDLTAISQSDWRLNSGSYLTAKGAPITTTGISSDKAILSFTSTPAAGAYEVPVGTPAFPTITGISAGNTTLSVSFTAPGTDGGSSITNYKYSTDGGITFTACSSAQTTSPISITSLTNGTSYNVQIKAVNANGDGASSNVAIAIPIATATTPAAPAITSITSGSGQLTINYSPGSDGGSSIMGYQYSTDGGTSFFDITTANPLVISTLSTDGTTALVNGTSYNVQIKAVNGNGNGTATASKAAIPSGIADAPTITSITSGNTTLSVAFTAPGNNGGSAITNYKYSIDGGTTFTAIYPGQTTSPILIPGLVNGTSYNVQLRAVNAAGDGTATASTVATPKIISAPTITGVSAGSASLTISFTAPADNAGYTITDYQYTTDQGSTYYSFGQTTSPYTITKVSASGNAVLVNGTSYNLQIRAVAAGPVYGSNSSPTSGTPVATATTPGIPNVYSMTPGNAQINVYFTPNGDGGSPLTRYEYSTDGGTTYTAVPIASVTNPIVITNQSITGTPALVNGTSYNVKIRAVNASGTGSASGTSAVIPFTVPSAPTITGITAGNSSLSVAFTAGSNGGLAINNYKYSTDGGTTWTVANTTLSPISISGLTNGTSYNVQIKAVSAAGDGIATASTAAQTVTAVSPTQATISQRIVTTTSNGIISEVTSAIQVYSVSGKLIQSINAVAGQKIYLQSGIYIVKANSEKGAFVQKVVL